MDNLEKFGVMELRQNEMKEVDGGCIVDSLYHAGVAVLGGVEALGDLFLLALTPSKW